MDININTATFQELFDFVGQRLVKQGTASMVGHSCVYRGPNSTKCAFGHLIPDEKYTDKMEYIRAANVLRFLNGVEDGLNAECSFEHNERDRFINRLQDCHDSAGSEALDDEMDGASFLDLYKTRMVETATRYDLNTEKFLALFKK